MLRINSSGTLPVKNSSVLIFVGYNFGVVLVEKCRGFEITVKIPNITSQGV